MLTKKDTDTIIQIIKETSVTKEEFTGFKDQTLTLLDKVMGELKAIREDHTITSGYKDQLENHETRISKIEDILEPEN